MEVRVKHITNQEWSGISRFPNCYEALGPYFTRSGRIYTGISTEDAERLGNLLGENLKPGSEFWDTFRVRFGSEDVYLNTEDPLDELKYLFLKSHKRVADSSDNLKPTAHYYISNPHEEADRSNKRSRLKRSAFKEFDKLKALDVKKCLRLYGYKSDDVSDDIAEERLMTLVEQNPQRFFDKWVDNKSRITEFLIKEGVSKNVLRKNKNLYSYGTTTLGKTLEEAIQYIDDKENSELKATIVNEITVK